MINSANTAIGDVCKMSRENFNSVRGCQNFCSRSCNNFRGILTSGSIIMGIANSVGSRIGLFESLLATSASTALSTLPITIGGPDWQN